MDMWPGWWTISTSRAAICRPIPNSCPSSPGSWRPPSAEWPEHPLEPRARRVVKQTTLRARDRRRARLVIDIHTLEDLERLALNDIARVRLRLSEPLAVNPYPENRAAGAFILIDEATNDTLGAGMILSASG